jgi:hypothetical protein
LPSGESRYITPDVPMPPGPYQVSRVDIKSQDMPEGFVSRVLIPAIAPLPALDGLDHLHGRGPFTAEDLNRLADGPVAKTLVYLRALGFTLDARTLTVLKRFSKLRELVCSGKTSTDDVFGRLHELTSLRYVTLLDCPGVGETARRALTRLPLQGVGLGRCKAVDRDLCRRFAAMPTLIYLMLNGSPVQDDWLSDLAQSAQLRTLYLAGTPVTDAGLARLAGLKTLKELYLGGSKVTKAGVARLAAALPECQITWDGGVVAPRSAAAESQKP